MANEFLTTSLILQESMMLLTNNLQFARYVNKEYSKEFAVQGAKVGSTINARKPPKYMGGYGNGLHLEDINEVPVPVVVDKLFGVHLSYTDLDLTLTMDRFRTRYLDSAVARIANEIDSVGLNTLYPDVYNSVGTPGTVPNALLTYLNAGVYLDNTGTPRRGANSRNAVIGSQMQATLINANAGLFHSGDAIRKNYEDGEMGYQLGFNFSMDQNIPTHTVGPLGGTPAVNGANQTGSNLLVNGWNAAAANRYLKGDTFTIAGVFSVKVQTASATGAISTGVLQQFTVTADTDSAADGSSTVPISPAIVPSGAGQTVTNSPATGTGLTTVGAANTVSPVGLAFHKNFATLVTVDLEQVRGVDMMGRISDDDLGLSMRLVRAYDINTNSRPTRLETLFGWAMLYAEMAARIHS